MGAWSPLQVSIYIKFRYHLYCLDKIPHEHYIGHKYVLDSSRAFSNASGGVSCQQFLMMNGGVENLVFLAIRNRQVEVRKVQLGLARLSQEVVKC